MIDNVYIRAKTALQLKYQRLHQRDKVRLLFMVVMLILVFAWWVLIAIPMRILHQADAQQSDLDAQLQAVQNLKAQAQSLKAQPIIKRDALIAVLQSSVKAYGASAQLDMVGDRVTLTLRALPADALAQWLALARTDARTLPLEARLLRATSAAPAWDGSIVLSMPAQ